MRAVRRVASLCVIVIGLAACGGKIEAGPTPDSGAPPDEAGGMILQEGGLLEGKCQMVCDFKGNGYDWASLTDSPAVTTAARPTPATFSFNCGGSGGGGFYYHIELSAEDVALGDHTVNGDMIININGRESETATGACLVRVDAIGPKGGFQTVSGTFDCPNLPVVYGQYSMRGPFEVPLPK